MLVTTAEPLTMSQMIELSKTNDALIRLGDFKCRYMMASKGQEIEVPLTYYDPNTKLAFGLRPVSKPNGKYDYLAFRIY